MKRFLSWTVAVGCLWAISWGEAGAQAGEVVAAPLAGQSLKGYTHMFLAYSVAWALIFGWVVSIAVRLKRLEKNPKD